MCIRDRYSGSQKAAFAIEGAVLIDDREKNINAWVEAGGIGILHTSAANTIDQLKALRNGGNVLDFQKEVAVTNHV